jgi:hypothetical protein
MGPECGRKSKAQKDRGSASDYATSPRITRVQSGSVKLPSRKWPASGTILQ